MSESWGMTRTLRDWWAWDEDLFALAGGYPGVIRHLHPVGDIGVEVAQHEKDSQGRVAAGWSGTPPREGIDHFDTEVGGISPAVADQVSRRRPVA